MNKFIFSLAAVLILLSGCDGVNSDIDKMIGFDRYAVDEDDWNTNLEYVYSTPNSSEVFEAHLRDYKDIIDTTKFL